MEIVRKLFITVSFLLMLHATILPKLGSTNIYVSALNSSADDTAKTIVAMKHLLTSLFTRYKRDMKSLKSVVMRSNAAVNQMEANYNDIRSRLDNLERSVSDLLNSEKENMIDENEIIVERSSDTTPNNPVSDDRISKLEELSRAYAPRTCYELKKKGVTKTGRYYIDPDGHELDSSQPIEGNDF